MGPHVIAISMKTRLQTVPWELGDEEPTNPPPLPGVKPIYTKPWFWGV